MIATPDAFDIASRFLDSGKARNDLELAILRHMEWHIAKTVEVCATIAETTITGTDNVSVHEARGAEKAAAAIRARK